MRATIQKYLRIPFVRDIATLQVGQLVGTACGFLSSILFARLLGLGGFGQYAVVLAFTGIFGFLTNLGQGMTTVTFLAEAQARGDKKAVAEVLHYYVAVSVLTILIIAALIPVLPALTDAIYGDPELGRLARILFFSSIIDPVFVGISVALQTVREIRTLTILENGRVTAQLGLSVLFMLAGYGVAGVLLGTLIGTALFTLIAVGFYPRLRRTYGFPSVMEVVRTGSLGTTWRYAKDGLWIALDKNLSNLYPNIFLFALSTQTSEAVVGLMRLGFKLGNLPASFVLGNISRMASTVLPALAGRGAPLRGSLIRLGGHTGALYLGASIGAAIVVTPLIPVVYGEAFAVAAYPFLVVLTLHLMSPVHAMITPILRLKSRIYWASLSNAIGIVLGIAVFIVAMTMLRPTLAFYLALFVYQLCAAAVLVPTLTLLRPRRTS